MPLFLMIARDKPGAIETRMRNRPAHLEWVAQHAEKVAMAGPMFEADGETFAGSLFVLDLPDEAAVRAWSAEDPYVKADLFGDVEIRPFRWAIGQGPKPADG